MLGREYEDIKTAGGKVLIPARTRPRIDDALFASLSEVLGNVEVRIRPFVTDEVERFDELAKRFLGVPTDPAWKVDLPAFTPA